MCLAGPASEARRADPPCAIDTPNRVVAVADVHGAFDKLTAILREAGILDAQDHWAGGRAIFVQLGDVLDRGPDSRKALDLLRRLESEAPRAGGRVIDLLGNHEVMRMLGDLRYVSAQEYEAFKSPNANDLRERYYQAVLATAPARARAAGQRFDEDTFRRQFIEDVPLGYVEMRAAFEPDGEYGGWLRGHDAMARINGVIFLHGGTTPEVAAMGCEAIDLTIRRELLAPPALDDPRFDRTLIGNSDGPLWYRGLADDASDLTNQDVETMLQRLHAQTIVVGHTPEEHGRVLARFGTRVVQLDTGMLDGTFYPNGQPSALEIQNGTYTAIYLGHRETLFRK